MRIETMSRGHVTANCPICRNPTIFNKIETDGVLDYECQSCGYVTKEENLEYQSISNQGRNN